MLVCLLAFGAGLPRDAAPQSSAQQVRADYADLLAYLGALDRAGPKDLDSLATLEVAIWQSDTPIEERHRAVAAYVGILWPLLELDRSYRMFHDLDRVVAQYNSLIDAYPRTSRPDLTRHRKRGAARDWRLHVTEEGTGTTPLLLIGDLGVEARVLYADFMERNRGKYRMFAATFPGIGAAQPQPYPERRDYAARPWLSGFERAIVRFLEERSLTDVVVVGTAAGGYVAARLALDQPRRFRAAVLAGALIHTPALSPADPNRPRTLPERIEDANRIIPTELAALPPPPSDPREIAAILRDPKRSYPGLFNFFAGALTDVERTIAWSARLSASDGDVARAYEYFYELYTTDLGAEIGALAVPTLMMIPGYDGTAPATRALMVAQWQEMRLRYPNAPLQVASFEGQPGYIAAESPEVFSEALAAFLAGRPVPGDSTPRPATTAAPRAAVMQSLDSLDVVVRYRRPAWSGQEVWGKTVPFGRVWNPGAAETTTITFSRDAAVEGRRLPAGTYTLLMIPDRRDWTVIFNGITDQWQNSTYNPAFDALRVTVHPDSAERASRLIYVFEDSSEDGMTLVLRWEGVRIPLRITHPAGADAKGQPQPAAPAAARRASRQRERPE